MATKRSIIEIDDTNASIQPSKKQKLHHDPYYSLNTNVAQPLNPALLSERDLQHEEDVKVHPYYLKNWLFYIQTKQEEIDDMEEIEEQDESDIIRLKHIKLLLYERSLKYLSGSYKLWYNYLLDRIDLCKPLSITDPFIEETNNCFDRCLAYLHKMPRIWMMYGEFLMYQRYITRTRKTFDRMLKALPITQHDRVWPLYLKFVRIAQVPEMGVRVYRRFIQMYPSQMEEFVDYLLKQKRFDEACVKLVDIVNNDRFDSIRGKSKFDFWKLLCQLLIKNAKSIKSLNVDAIIRSGIKRYPQEIGRLWVDLAEYYLRLGQFEKGRDIYNEGITSVTSVRDFGIVFDCFAKFEENMIAMKMSEIGDDADGDDDDLFEFDSLNDLPLRIDRLEELYKNRRILLSSVKLRQNPHNVDEWIKRAKIYLEIATNDDDDDDIDASKVIETYTQSISVIDPFKANGDRKLSQIWIEFGRFYEEYGDDIEDVRTIYKKGVEREFKNIDDLASIWCEFAEMELRHKNYEECRNVLKKATALPNNNIHELLSIKNKDRKSIKVQDRLFKSKRLWNFMIDIEESMGTLCEAKSVYNTVIDLRIASVQTILNYADLMARNNYFEESFRVYSRGIALFDHPHVLPIWKTYLFKFINRYRDTKIERARDLFEECLAKCPASTSKEIYLMYARFEEKYGFGRHAMRVYDSACSNIEEKERKEMYHIYINRAADLFGITKTRQIYEKAIQNLSEDLLTDICLSYISLELKLSEIDRARAIFEYGAQFANPKKFEYFWNKWHEFEVSFGNEDTFKEMLRIRRSVDVEYTQIEYNEINNNKEKEDVHQIKEMEQKAIQRQCFVEEKTITNDPNEINIENDNNNKDDPNEIDIDLQEQAIPNAVYIQSSTKKKVGALDRFNH